jgi:RND family efflux transporter MFP subunit
MSKNQTKAIGKAKKDRSGVWQLLFALAITTFGILILLVLIKLKKPPQRVEKENPAPLVEVTTLNIRDIQMIVSSYGTVTPKVQVEIVPQVSGKVVSVNPQFKAGGFIPAGSPLLEIDPRDYELAVQQAQAIVAEAVVKLDLEKAEAQVARQEWNQINPNTEPTSPLVLRQPQIRQAQAKLESAEAQLAAANLSLERTELFLPIDVRIVSEKIDLGQYVIAGQSLGTAYGTESVEIELPLEDKELAWFDVPDGKDSPSKPVEAEVKANFAGAEQSWIGYVKRTTGQVDKTSRLISVVIEVPEPFDTSGGRNALLPGMFVEVFIKGKELKNAAAVPRNAIRSSNEVWLVNDGRLHIQPLEIVRSDKDFAYAVSGVDDGATIVLSSLDMATEGMKVRVQAKIPTQNEQFIENESHPGGPETE